MLFVPRSYLFGENVETVLCSYVQACCPRGRIMTILIIINLLLVAITTYTIVWLWRRYATHLDVDTSRGGVQTQFRLVPTYKISYFLRGQAPVPPGQFCFQQQQFLRDEIQRPVRTATPPNWIYFVLSKPSRLLRVKQPSDQTRSVANITWGST